MSAEASFQASFFLTAILCYLPVGVVSLVFAIIDRSENDEPTCGQEGSPPIRDWLFGTGIAFLIMAVSHMISACFPVFLLASGCSPCFMLAWAIVGVVSLARDAKDCKEEDPTLWKVSLAMVIITFILACGCGFTTTATIKSQE